MEDQDHYKVLGLDETATFEDITRRFRFLAKKFHPDKSIADKDANDADKDYTEREFKKINEANQVLSDPKQREAYDNRRKANQNNENQGIIAVAPPEIDFGIISIGEQSTQSCIVNFSGAQQIEFEAPWCEPQDFFKIGNCDSIHSDNYFPVKVEIIADARTLSSRRTIKGTAFIKINGQKEKVNLLFSTAVPQKPSSSSVAKSAPPSTHSGPLSFSFKNGAKAYHPEDLIPLCDQFWDEAKDYLYSPNAFKKWFIDLHRNDMVSKLDASSKESNHDIGLEKFLQAIKPGLTNPFIKVNPKNTNLTNYDFHAGGTLTPELEITNKGRGCCYGEIRTTKPWLSSQTFAVPPGKELIFKLKIDPSALEWEKSFSATVHLECNCINLPQPSYNFSVSTALHPLTTRMDDLRLEIKGLQEEGKWRLALEKVERYDDLNKLPSKFDLKSSIEYTRDKFIQNIGIINAIVYAAISFLILQFYMNMETSFGIAIILGLCSFGIGYLSISKYGGNNGKSFDRNFGIASPLIVAIIIIPFVIIWLIPCIGPYIVVGILIYSLIFGGLINKSH